MSSLFDEISGIDMKTATAKKPAAKAKKQPELSFEIPQGGYVVEIRRGGTPEQSRAACGAMLERMRADKRRGDVAKFMREFRSNPRG